MVATPPDPTLADIRAFLKRHDMAPSRFGRLAVNDPGLIDQIRGGRELRRATLHKLQTFMRDRDEQLTIASEASERAEPPHRLNAEAR